MIVPRGIWPRFGGVVEANWESDGLLQYSTLDRPLLSGLAADESWSNEGLFALILGLLRLRALSPSRVADLGLSCELH